MEGSHRVEDYNRQSNFLRPERLSSYLRIELLWDKLCGEARFEALLKASEQTK